MNGSSAAELLARDREHVWHPYAAMPNPLPVLPVAAARGTRLELADGRELVDGMSSWWAAIHGYNHPVLNRAIEDQCRRMAHVMFGGLTHEPAVRLAARLVEITPATLTKVFFADSGSVAVEVALKMAVQYWASRGEPGRQRFLTVRSGYHGDTLGAMAVCDPVTGMHQLFAGVLPEHHFAEAPPAGYGRPWDEAHAADLRSRLEAHAAELAAVILEPIVQGAGGMRFYSPAYLRRVRELCDEHGVLLILDEIATGFGRTGRLFACEHASVAPDILCLGKALTGGYLTLAATLTTERVSAGIAGGSQPALMHGPTFMANPLACAVAGASVDLLLESPWRKRVDAIERRLAEGLASARELPAVADVRVLGAIGVVELTRPVAMERITAELVSRGVWLRPFGRLLYTMPPFVASAEDVDRIAAAMVAVASDDRNLEPRET